MPKRANGPIGKIVNPTGNRGLYEVLLIFSSKIECNTEKKVGTSARITGFERRLKLAANGL